MKLIDVHSQNELNQQILTLLRKQPDSNYVLFLSGGASPVELYKFLAKTKTFPLPNELAQVDERVGENAVHKTSNLKLFFDSGIINIGTHFTPIITEQGSADEQTVVYQRELAKLFAKYRGRVVAIMGMGLDGHTAGVLPNTIGVTSANLVEHYFSDDAYKERVTVTLTCITEHFSTVLLLLIGQEKITKFNEIMANESDSNKFPVLVYKTMPDVTVLCMYQ